jgi:N-glycosylase/DNA lyase
MTNAQLLLSAVTAILPDIAGRVSPVESFEEHRLWWELSCCVLSSQVSYPLACAAADAIHANQLLEDRTIATVDLAGHLSAILGQPLVVEGKLRRYRFPLARAGQLALACATIRSTDGSFHDLMHSFEDGFDARAWFVRNASGLGPKQASMFVRNSGLSYDLAIIDRHVVRYMAALGLHTGEISGMRRYLMCEEQLRRHADQLGFSVGILDWAVWIVMRMANERAEEGHL